MYQFFVDPSNIHDKEVINEGNDYNHIKNVLRMKIGEEINVVTGSDDKEYRCSVKAFEDDCVLCTLLFIKTNDVELPCEITLLQGLPKSDKMELIIQKAVELGVYSVVPVSMNRSVVKLDSKKEASKLSRWNMISEAAAKQSKRRIIPEVTKVMSVKEALDYCKDMDIKLLPYELSDMDAMARTREILSSINKGEKVAIFIGPEGGFSEEEVKKASEMGFLEITLGHRILRTETAGMTLLSWLVYLLEA